MKTLFNTLALAVAIIATTMLLGACGGSADKKKSAGPTTPTLNFALDLPHSGSLDIGEISVFKITGISEGLPLL
ncbi:MAG: hypothetical protein OEZ59_14195, partial [Deltaproteobacteria bacterium]|nr:hypothetical protein [Deltaproteobacteria bacterium]